MLKINTVRTLHTVDDKTGTYSYHMELVVNGRGTGAWIVLHSPHPLGILPLAHLVIELPEQIDVPEEDATETDETEEKKEEEVCEP